MLVFNNSAVGWHGASVLHNFYERKFVLWEILLNHSITSTNMAFHFAVLQYSSLVARHFNAAQFFMRKLLSLLLLFLPIELAAHFNFLSLDCALLHMYD
jgi:hypothetical protein